MAPRVKVFFATENFWLKAFVTNENFIKCFYLNIDMLSKEELRGILSDQKESFDRDEQTIERDINLEQYIKIDPIVIISKNKEFMVRHNYFSAVSFI